MEVQRLLRTREVIDKIAATKLYSREAGVGLAKAKEVIDQMIAEMKRQQEEEQENDHHQGIHMPQFYERYRNGLYYALHLFHHHTR